MIKKCELCQYYQEGCILHRVPEGCFYLNPVFKWQKEGSGIPIKKGKL
ncbi:MAG: hypothetical protein ACFFD2_17185 [Promethearchaeota archaeon]